MKEAIKNNLVIQYETLKRAHKILQTRIEFLEARKQERPSHYVSAEIAATEVSIVLIEAEQLRVNVQMARIRDLESKKWRAHA